MKAVQVIDYHGDNNAVAIVKNRPINEVIAELITEVGDNDKEIQEKSKKVSAKTLRNFAVNIKGYTVTIVPVEFDKIILSWRML